MKVRAALVAAVGTVTIFTFSTSTATASGDPAGWQLVGGSDFYPDAEGSGCHTKPLNSGGGNIRVTYHTYGGHDEMRSLGIWEYDPDNPDDFIIRIDVANGWSKTANVDGFTDGANGKAELIFRGPCTGAPWITLED
ncbi:hypothetical protein GCM10009647_002540 [Streptomyces sanglieri]|uniref:Secreted protein n=1 Tax=Streptomyces sanglieri TaxID=193460 RepID=A0ABW2WZE7_9ACTN